MTNTTAAILSAVATALVIGVSAGGDGDFISFIDTDISESELEFSSISLGSSDIWMKIETVDMGSDRCVVDVNIWPSRWQAHTWDQGCVFGQVIVHD